ncbi:MAG: hypothetical protein E6713_16665 [Sporomusaceae bacterium]|nr:hypothetical protein [Sporomusaceae bacterium]
MTNKTSQSKNTSTMQSKNEYGTMTAKQDANNDYSSSSAASSTSSMASGAGTNTTSSQQTSTTKNKQSKDTYGTLTAKYDSNNDYGE